MLEREEHLFDAVAVEVGPQHLDDIAERRVDRPIGGDHRLADLLVDG